MKLILCLLASAAALLLSSASYAAVISRDWKTPGDGLLTYDDVNQREWLDLSQTLLSDQFPGNDPSPHTTRENRYQYVLSQTSPKGLFQGFSVGTAPDAIALAESAGINTAIRSQMNASAARLLGQLLKITSESSRRPHLPPGKKRQHGRCGAL